MLAIGSEPKCAENRIIEYQGKPVKEQWLLHVLRSYGNILGKPGYQVVGDDTFIWDGTEFFNVIMRSQCLQP